MRRTRLLLAFLLFLMAFALKPANANKNTKHFKWNKEPTVVVCYQDFPIYLLYRAIDFWGIRGKEIEGIIPNAPSGICAVDYIPDTIIIRRAPKRKLKLGELAVTNRINDGEGSMIASVIWFDPHRLHEPYIIEHELGHALGLGHVNKDKHIMNPWSEHMGPEFWIP